MKAILEFNLPDDIVDFKDAVNGGDWKHAMWKVDQELRSRTKYAPDTMSDETYKALEEVRDFLHQTLNQLELNLD
jgi:hypothetical protein